MTTKIRLKAFNSQYVCAEDGGGSTVVANRPAAASWETFDLILPPGAQLGSGLPVSFKTYNGHYLCAEGGGGGPVVANRTAIGPWEVFRITGVGNGGSIGSGSRVSLQAWNGQYLCAEGGGGGEVVANRDAVLGWEMFTLEAIEIPEAITADAEMDFGGGKHGSCHAVVDAFGLLSLLTTTWTNSPFQGFTMGVQALLLDANGRAVLVSEPVSYGVDGTMTPFGSRSNRVDSYTQQFDPAVTRTVTEVRIVLFHAGRNRILDIIKQGGILIGELREVIDDFCLKNPDICVWVRKSVGL